MCQDFNSDFSRKNRIQPLSRHLFQYRSGWREHGRVSHVISQQTGVMAKLAEVMMQSRNHVRRTDRLYSTAFIIFFKFLVASQLAAS